MREPVVRSEGFWADFLNGFFLRPVYRCTPVKSGIAAEAPQDSTAASYQDPEGNPESPVEAEMETPARSRADGSSFLADFDHLSDLSKNLAASYPHMVTLPIEGFQPVLPFQDLSALVPIRKTEESLRKEVRQHLEEALTVMKFAQANPESAVLYLMVQDTEGHLVAVDPRKPEHADLLKEALQEIDEHPANAIRLDPPTFR